MHPSRAWFALGVLLIALADCSPPGRPPSLILVTIDTLRADYLGSHGYPGPVSPRLDAFAAEAVRFDRCYSAAPWTKPSVASLFTGLHPRAHGVTNHEGLMWGEESEAMRKGILAEDVTTLAETLAASGYRTGAFVANPWLLAEYGFGQGFEVYDDTLADSETPADSMLARANAWLASPGDDRPIFLYLHLMDVHGPYVAPDSVYATLVAAMDPDPGAILTPDQVANIPEYLTRTPWYNDEVALRLDVWRLRYAAGVRDLDTRLGAFLDQLRETGLLEGSVVVLTSDHGEELFEHGGWTHGYTLYQDQIRVPLLIRPPGSARPRTVREVVGLVDLMPTLLDLVGLPAGPGGADRSFAGAVETGEMGEPRVVMSSSTLKNPGLTSLCVGRYQLIENAKRNQVALFDVVEDPGNLRNVASANPELALELHGQLKQWLEDPDARGLFLPTSNEPTDKQKELLRSLGYVD